MDPGLANKIEWKSLKRKLYRNGVYTFVAALEWQPQWPGVATVVETIEQSANLLTSLAIVRKVFVLYLVYCL